MPITLEPIYRRNFITGSLIFGGSAWIKSYATAKPVNLDPTRVALLADTHISDDPSRSYPGTKWPGTPVKEDEHEWVNMADSLAQSVREIIALKPRPANLIINGDCALSRGTEAEYKEFLRLIEPIRRAGIKVHITIGNHDTREKLWKLLPFLKKEQMGIHADVIELPYANIFLLDSGKKGILGEAQLNWLEQQLGKHTDKPALVFAHFNPLPNRGVRPIGGMRDGEVLLKILAQRKHAKAYIHGHTHEWQHSMTGSIEIIGQPAVSYYFGKGHAHGWIDMKLTERSADLELHCVDPKHKQNAAQRQILFIG